MEKRNKLLLLGGFCLGLILTIILGLGVICLMAAPTQQVVPIKFKLAMFHTGSSTVVQTYHKWESIINEATGGRFQLKVYDSETLAKGPDFVDAVHRGIADLALHYPSYIAKTTPLGDLATLPMLIESDKHGWDIYHGGLFGLMDDEYAEHGWSNVKCMHVFLCGMGYLFTKGKPIKVPSDISGLKYRMTGAEADFIKECGGAAVFTRLGEVYEGIQRGIVNGARGSLGNIVDFKWYELKPMSGLDMPIMWAHLLLIGNKKSLDAIPKDLRPLVNTLLYSMVMDETVNRMKFDAYYKENLLPSQGLIWYKPTPEEIALWKAKSKPVIDAWIKRAGPRGKKALDLVEKYR